MEHALNVGDVVRFLANGTEILILVASIKKADTVILPPNSNLSDTTVFLPNPSPNAVSEILLCGKMFVNDGQESIRTASFGPAEICINYNDVVDVIQVTE